MSRPQIDRSVRTINGDEREVLRIAFNGRVVEAVELDMADQWDFMELAGRQIDNDPWVSTALLACSVIAIDGLPCPRGVRSRDDVRRILRKLGEDGVDAVQAALETSPRDQASSAEAEGAVGN
jgi:hypothetical protein